MVPSRQEKERRGKGKIVLGKGPSSCFLLLMISYKVVILHAAIGQVIVERATDNPWMHFLWV
jgi:hypothetical protein